MKRYYYVQTIKRGPFKRVTKLIQAHLTQPPTFEEKSYQEIEVRDGDLLILDSTNAPHIRTYEGEENE